MQNILYRNEERKEVTEKQLATAISEFEKDRPNLNLLEQRLIDGETITAVGYQWRLVRENTRDDAGKAIKFLEDFIPVSERESIISGFFGEEKQFFYDKAVEMMEIIIKMPHTHQQDGLGKNAIAHLHYFRGGMDWYITEKDIDTDGLGQIQAFGSANLGYGPELGYIAISELIENGVELDLYFTPKSLKELGI